LMALVWLYIITIYSCTMRIRLRVFNKEFMSQFADEHRAAFPEKPNPPQYGYPDTGYGWYGRKLDYYQWVQMASAQRVQLNTLEQMTQTMVWTVVGALKYPWAAFSLTLVYWLCKVQYTIGYMGNPLWRLPGALLNDLVFFG